MAELHVNVDGQLVRLTDCSRLAATATLGDEFWRWMKDGCSCDSEVSDG